MYSSVFICFTPYQLLNAVYYGDKLNKESKRILVWHNYTKHTIDLSRFEFAFDEIIEVSNFYDEIFLKRQFHKCLYGGWLFPFSKINESISRLNLKETFIFIFSDQHIISRKIITTYGANAKDVILVEEGMATYLIRSRKIPKSRDWLINLFLGARYEPYIGANGLIRTIFVKHPEMLPKEKTINRKIVPQHNVFREHELWKSVFQDARNIIGNISDEHRIVLWLGQPLEMDGISKQSQLEWLDEIAKVLSRFGEYSFLIKPHPREDNGKYAEVSKLKNVSLIDLHELSWVPIEILASLIKPDIVLTVFSTAANNIMELGLPCKVVYCYPAFEINMGNEINHYVNSNSNVYCIRNVGDFISVLAKEYHNNCLEDNNTNSDLSYMKQKMKNTDTI